MNATCDECGQAIAEGHAQTQSGLYVCDACLAGPRGESSDSEWLNRQFAAAAREKRGINIDAIEATIARATGSIVEPQINRVRESLERACRLYHAGEPLAAMEALQTTWEIANGLHNVLAVKSEVLSRRRQLEGLAEQRVSEETRRRVRAQNAKLEPEQAIKTRRYEQLAADFSLGLTTVREIIEGVKHNKKPKK